MMKHVLGQKLVQKLDLVLWLNRLLIMREVWKDKEAKDIL